MQGTVNAITLVGRVGKVEGVGKIAVLSVGLKERKGEATVTEWHRVKVLREQLTKSVLKNVKVGQTVAVLGKLRLEKYLPKNEKKERVQAAVYAHEVEIISWNKPESKHG